MPEASGRNRDCEGCSRLVFTPVTANRPCAITLDFWSQGTVEGELCGHKQTGHIEVWASGLIPLGIYTIWFVGENGVLYPAAPTNAVYTADSLDPNRLIVNGDGVINYYIAPLNFNPFRGIPVAQGKVKITNVVIVYHTDRMTHGLTPGERNVNYFIQFNAPIALPREDVT